VRARTIAGWLILLIVGAVIGWTGGHYWMHEMRKAESMLALDQANTAAQRGDLDTAIQHATQSWTLYPDSPLAGQMLTELRDKRSAKLAGCTAKQTP
jgi:sensor histidine kinase regulating citrate/malate metabolism